MRIGSFVVSLAGWLAIPLAAASAAPQALGLVAMDRPVPLRCEAGLCQAEFTSFCLQKARAFPGKGTVYEVAETGGLTLRVTEPGGRVREIDAAAHVRISTPRAGHAAVTISLPEAVLAELGGRRAAIAIGPRVTLTPRAHIGDPDPQSSTELAEATGSRRALGADLVDGAGTVERVRGLTALVNTVPRVIDRRPDAEARLWSEAMRRGLDRVSPARLRVAAREYERCWDDRVVRLGGYSANECLRRRHDELMNVEVKRYWKASDPGS